MPLGCSTRAGGAIATHALLAAEGEIRAESHLTLPFRPFVFDFSFPSSSNLTSPLLRQLIAVLDRPVRAPSRWAKSQRHSSRSTGSLWYVFTPNISFVLHFLVAGLLLSPVPPPANLASCSLVSLAGRICPICYKLAATATAPCARAVSGTMAPPPRRHVPLDPPSEPF